MLRPILVVPRAPELHELDPSGTTKHLFRQVTTRREQDTLSPTHLLAFFVIRKTVGHLIDHELIHLNMVKYELSEAGWNALLVHV